MNQQVLLGALLIVFSCAFFSLGIYQSSDLLFFVLAPLAFLLGLRVLRWKEDEAFAKAYFLRDTDLRWALVEAVVAAKQPLPKDVSPHELAAICVLKGFKTPISEILEWVTNLSQDGFSQKFNDDFFNHFNGASARLGSKHRREIATLGEALAKLHNQREWQQKFAARRRESLPHARFPRLG